MPPALKSISHYHGHRIRCDLFFAAEPYRCKDISIIIYSSLYVTDPYSDTLFIASCVISVKIVIMDKTRLSRKSGKYCYNDTLNKDDYTTWFVNRKKIISGSCLPEKIRAEASNVR